MLFTIRSILTLVWDVWSFLSFGTQQDPEFVFVNERMSWSNAQKHCRENFIDLATVRNFNDTEKFLSWVQKGKEVWIGLYRDPDFNWSNGSPSTYTYWKRSPTPLGSMSVECVLCLPNVFHVCTWKGMMSHYRAIPPNINNCK
uniref:C-type lectin domain-containing protein n=1 Tax=Labrus bergylta TaxID=56723 RepID=A0A3Q3F7K1_9LABR